jgi:hypothetical protein
MNIEREVKVRDAIKYCIENFDSQTATNRIVEFWKDELKLQEQQCNIANVVGRSEQLFCSCGSRKVKTTGGSQCTNNRCSL